jgi:cell wall-associated NlpC family hydrolase
MSVLPLDPTTEQLLRSLQSDYDVTTPDAHVIAAQIATSRTQRGKATPKQADLAKFLTGIAYDFTTGAAGAPTLTLTLFDPQWHILESGFFDADDNGKLDEIDLNYPDGSRFWWRLHQVSPQQSMTVEMVFVPRVISKLMNHVGPIKVNRATRTRAEFLKMLCAKVTNDPQGIEFYCRELDIKQPVGVVTTTKSQSSSKAPAKKAAKSKGLGANANNVTIKGYKPDTTQQGFINLILQVCEKEGASNTVTEACTFAAIMESDMGKDMGWDASNPTYGGLLAGSQGNFASFGPANSQQVAEAQIKSFIHGGRGYNAASSLQSKYQDIGALAAHVEGCILSDGSFGPNDYGQYGQEAGVDPAQVISEAKAIVQAGGGGGSNPGTGAGTIAVAQPYYFTVNAGEDYWTAMTRLAQEVAWELIVDGNRIYYDQDRTLIGQKVAAIFDRDDRTTLLWNYDWVNREIATNFQIQVICHPMEFCAGEVVMVKGFGAASTGSTMNLPGRWLITEVARNAGDVFATFSLVQPAKALPEPEPQTTTENVGGVGGTTLSTSLGSTTPGTAQAAFAAAQLLKSYKLPYVWGGGHGTLDKKPTGLDCSGSVGWVLAAAGFTLPNGAKGLGGLGAPVSGAYYPGVEGLQAGPGKEMTIYANAGHVFIRIHPQGLADMQGNTVAPLVGNRGFDFFPWNTSGCGSDGGPSPSGFQMVHYPGT